MKFYTIEIDEKVWNYLKKNAEPFKDTPNSVLNRILFGESKKLGVSIAPPSKSEKPLPKVELYPENDLTVDGIKVELESNSDQDKNPGSNLSESLNRPDPDFEDLQIEIEGQFVPDRDIDGLSQMTENDKDIDAFIKDLEKNKSTDHVVDEFADVLKEIPGTNDGEWKEISFHPKHNFESTPRKPVTEPNPKQSDISSNPATATNREKVPERKKPKLMSLEDKLVYSLGKRLENQWGKFRSEGVGLLIFANKTVLCKYSKYNEQHTRWLWGVSQADRYAWGPQNWLALILENEDQKSFSFLLFNSQESGVLFDQCKQTTGDKYITMLIDEAYDSLRLQEWRHLDLRDRRKALPFYNPEEE